MPSGNPMVLQLKKRFVRTAMGALSLILLLMIAVLNLLNLYQINRSADEVLSTLAYYNGVFPEQRGDGGAGRPDTGAEEGRMPPAEAMPPANIPTGDQLSLLLGLGDDALHYNRMRERPFHTRYFYVAYPDGSGETMTDVSHIASITEEEATALADKVRNERSASLSGNIGVYRYTVKHESLEGVTRYIFIDRSEDLFGARRLLIFSVAIGCVTLLLMYLLVRVFAGRAVMPAVESMEKQQRFITDAGHELKTPLAVISADVDVLGLEGVKNEWTDSIRAQVKQMTGLIENMLLLSKMEEAASVKQEASPLDFSAVASECIESFRPVAVNRGLTLFEDIAPALRVKGDRNALTRLVTLLVDNALKYCADGGTVSVVLRPEDNAGSRKRVRLEVSNPCELMPEGNLDRLFDRFYRADAARSKKTGGFGLGLSAAKAIALSHGGTINAVRDGDRTIRFVAVLPGEG